jgi:hypothetical protein
MNLFLMVGFTGDDLLIYGTQPIQLIPFVANRRNNIVDDVLRNSCAWPHRSSLNIVNNSQASTFLISKVLLIYVGPSMYLPMIFSVLVDHEL